MQVKVLFFGATAEIAAARTLDVHVAEETNADQLLAAMIARFPALASHKLHISINQQYASGDSTIADADEISIFTAVSGG